MAGYTKGTRVGYSDSVGKRKDQRSNDLKQSSSVSSNTNAKTSVDSVKNEARESQSSAEIATRTKK